MSDSRAQVESDLLALLIRHGKPMPMDQVVEELSKTHPRFLAQSVMLSLMDTPRLRVTPLFELALGGDVRKSA